MKREIYPEELEALTNLMYAKDGSARAIFPRRSNTPEWRETPKSFGAALM